MTKEKLIEQVHFTAADAEDYLYDGPSSSTVMETCDGRNCVAKFPRWIMGEGEIPPTVGAYFNSTACQSPWICDGLSQYNGSAIWLKLDDAWHGNWRRVYSQFIHNISGTVNSYGMGTLFHEVLHKKYVAGGFTHNEMCQALGIRCDASGPHNVISDIIGQRCFAE